MEELDSLNDVSVSKFNYFESEGSWQFLEEFILVLY